MRWILVMCLLIGFPGNAGANDDLRPTPEQVRDRNVTLQSLGESLWKQISRLQVGIDNSLVSTAEFQGARAAWYRVGLTIEGAAPVSDRASVSVSPSIAFERLDFAGSDNLILSRMGRDGDLDRFLDGSLRAGASYRFDHGLGLEAVAAGNFRQEVGASFEDSLSVGGSLAGTYRRGKWLRLRLGLGIGADVADGELRLTPVYRIQIRPHKDWSLETSGLNGSVAWDYSKSLQLSLSGALQGTQYRLNRRGRPPTGLGSGTLQRRQTIVETTAVYRVSRWLRLQGEVGVVVREELSVLDSNGRELDVRKENDPSFITSFRIEIRR